MNPAELFRQDESALNLAAGDFLFREGDVGDRMYVLLEGNMDVLLGELVVETAKPGALLGEMALIDDAPRSASAVAKTPCTIVEISQRRFHFLVQQTPNFATHVLKVLAGRLRKMDRLLLAAKR